MKIDRIFIILAAISIILFILVLVALSMPSFFHPLTIGPFDASGQVMTIPVVYILGVLDFLIFIINGIRSLIDR